MNGLIIQVDWVFFLGIIGTLILIAWYAGARFTQIETDVHWLKDGIKELKLSASNATKPAYASSSPINLTEIGKEWLGKSGLMDYIETHKEKLLGLCAARRNTNPYEVQQHIFKLFDEYTFETETENNLKRFCYEAGTSMEVLRRIGAIHFRDLCLKDFGMKREEIDIHDPDK